MAAILRAAGMFLIVVSSAMAEMLDFENLPGMSLNGGEVPEKSRLSDQFLLTSGVVFSSGSPYVAVVNLGEGHATSGFNGIGGTRPNGNVTYDGGFPIIATFFDPNNPTAFAVTDFVSLRIDQTGTSGMNVRLEAFDVSGQLVDSDTSLDIGGATLEVSHGGIHSVRFIGTLDLGGAAVDDFRFNPVVAVPEPSAFGLIATAFVLGALRYCGRRSFPFRSM